MKKIKHIAFAVLILAVGFTSCTISYKFNGSSIDYAKIKTISIVDFPNMASFVYPTLSSMFSEALRDKYSRQTRLQQVRSGGDMDIQGEIVDYDVLHMSVKSDGLAAEVRLTLTVNVRYSNRQQPEEDFEKRYSASETFDSNIPLDSIQDQLLKEMIEDITDQIFNDTAAKW